MKFKKCERTTLRVSCVRNQGADTYRTQIAPDCVAYISRLKFCDTFICW